jgi:hypothetical protein
MTAQKQAAVNNMTFNSDISSILGIIQPLELIQGVLASRPARAVLPNTPAGHVNDACYRDVMDMLDSVVATKMWAIQSEYLNIFSKYTPISFFFYLVFKVKRKYLDRTF